VSDWERGGGNKRSPTQRGHGYRATAGGDGHDSGHDHGGHRAVDFAGACPCRRPSGGGGGDLGRRRPATRMGPLGELAHSSPRAPDGGTRDEGGRLRDVGAPSTRHRGLVVARYPSSFGRPRSAFGPGAGTRRRAAGSLCQYPGRAGTVAGVPRPWRLAQSGAERRATDPWRSRMAHLPCL
jgi:hypothetical protein